MENVQNGIVKVFSELKEMGIEIWLSEQGWMQYEELLIDEEKAS